MVCLVLAAGSLLPQVGFTQLLSGSALREASDALAESRLIRSQGHWRLQDGGLSGMAVEAVVAEPLDSGLFKRFKAGSYVLRNQPNVRQYGQLKLRNGRKLIVKTIAGKTRRVKAQESLSYAIGQHHYTVINQLQFDSNARSVNEKAAYAQVLDSGKFVLLRYDYLLNTGSGWLFLHRYPTSVYLLRGQPDSAFIAIGDTYDKVYFQQHVRQFLVTRADLVTMLDAGLITYQNFPNAIHALNQNLPFYPLAVPESKKQ